MTKNLALGLILTHLTQIRAVNFFFKNLASSVTKYHGQLSSCTISEKTNDPILRKLDGQTDGQMDESDFIGCCPTNVERPKTIMISCKNAVFDLFIRKFSQIRRNDSRQYSRRYK